MYLCFLLEVYLEKSEPSDSAGRGGSLGNGLCSDKDEGIG